MILRNKIYKSKKLKIIGKEATVEKDTNRFGDDRRDDAKVSMT